MYKFSLIKKNPVEVTYYSVCLRLVLTLIALITFKILKNQEIPASHNIVQKHSFYNPGLKFEDRLQIV